MEVLSWIIVTMVVLFALVFYWFSKSIDSYKQVVNAQKKLIDTQRDQNNTLKDLIGVQQIEIWDFQDGVLINPKEKVITVRDGIDCEMVYRFLEDAFDNPFLMMYPSPMEWGKTEDDEIVYSASGGWTIHMENETLKSVIF